MKNQTNKDVKQVKKLDESDKERLSILKNKKMEGKIIKK